MPDFRRLAFQAAPHLGEGGGLKLADPLLRQAQFHAETLQRPALVPQLALGHDVALARAQVLQGAPEPAAQQFAIMRAFHRLGGLYAVILQRLDPLATVLIGLLHRVQRKVRAGQPPFHHLDIRQRYTQGLGDAPTQRDLVQPFGPIGGLALQFRLHPPKVEEQRLLA